MSGLKTIFIVKSKHWKEEDAKYFAFIHHYMHLELECSNIIERLSAKIDVNIN